MPNKYNGDDKYLDPETGILRNLLGLKSQTELDHAEAIFVAIQSEDMIRHPLQEGSSGPDFSYILEIHRRLFFDIFDWAGNIRDVDISKGSTRFANFEFIEREGMRICREMASENWLVGRSHADFAEGAAYYLGELNSLHPFREGNGRTLRQYFRYIAERAGHSLTWEGVTREEMVTASIYAHNVDHQLLRGIILRQMTCC